MRISPQFDVYASLLRQFRNTKALSDGKHLHACVVERQLEEHKLLADLLLQMYVSCGADDDASALFAKLPNKDIVSYNAMIAVQSQCGDNRGVLQLVQQMQREDVLPNKFTFLTALSACTSHAAIAEGKHLHSCILDQGLEWDVVLGTALLTMYGKCQTVEDACRMFIKLPEWDTVSWNAMIAAYAQHGFAEESFQLFHQMEREGIIPDKVTFLSILDACADKAFLAQGKSMHLRILYHGLVSKVAVGNALINMYNRCGSSQDSQEVFDNMHDRNVVSWTSIVATYVQHGQSMCALQLFQHMLLEGVMPNKITFISILSACTSIVEGQMVHALVTGCQIESDRILANALVNMYGKCGSVDLAQRMLDRMHDRDVVSWNSMIAADALHSLGKQALRHFRQMQMEGLMPNKATFASVLSACASQTSLGTAKQMHAHIAGTWLEADVAVGTALVHMYGKCGSLEDAQKSFCKVPKHDLIMLNNMITAYTQNGHAKEALQLFKQHQLEGLIPDKITFVSMLDACGIQATISEGKQMHVFIAGIGFELDFAVANALINMYGKCGRLKEAEYVFQTMPTRDIISWNAMIIASAQAWQGSKALQLFQEMQSEGIAPDKFTFACLLSGYTGEKALAEGKRIHACVVGCGLNLDIVVENALVNMYGKCGNLGAAQIMFDKISKQDIVSWNVLINAYIQCGQGKDALRLYHQMQPEGVTPDKITLICILSAYASEADLDEGKQIHAYIASLGLQADIAMGNAVVNMYGKCGCLSDAHNVFAKMAKRDVVSWNAIIAAYAHHGMGKEALQLLEQMLSEGLYPDKVTLVCVLAACSHAGLVEEGCQFFLSMNRDYGIITAKEHYNCVIDLLGRTGRLHEVEHLIQSMPIEPSYASWMTLLGACRKHLDVERGQRAADVILNLEPEKCASVVLLSNIYAAAGKWHDAGKARDVIRTLL